MQSEDMNYFRPRELRETLNWIFDMHRFYYDEPNVSIARPYDNLKMPARGSGSRTRDPWEGWTSSSSRS